VRCSVCGNENPPEFPPEEWPYCMQCGAQLPTGRPPFDPQPYPPPGPYSQPGPYQQPGAHQQPGPYPQPGPYSQPAPYSQPSPYPPGDTPILPSGQGPAQLILESGLGKIEYPLDAPVVTIGRSRSNDISLEDSRVSRHHARIVRDARGFIIEDLNSRNGTRVDDRAVRDSATLSDGSVVRIGDSVFRFTMAPAAPQPPPPAPGPSPWGGGHGGYGPSGGQGGAPAPEVFVSPWSPVQCPSCQGLKTMRPIVYGPAAQSPGAQAAARRGEVTLGEGSQRPDGPNAECRACGARVRIVNTGG